MNINSIEVRNLEAIETIAIHHRGDYSGIGAAFGRLAEWASAGGYWAKRPRMVGIYHSDPATTPPDQRRSTAALEDKGGMTPAAGMERYTVSGGKYLVMNAEVVLSEYGEAWEKIDAEALERGLAHDTRDHYELYVSAVDGTQSMSAPWIVEFRVPIK